MYYSDSAEYSKPTARDHLRNKVNRERCYLRRCKLQLVNQVADAGDLPVPRRALNQITVRVIHEGEISNEQENSERSITQAVAAGYHVDGVAILIERDVEYPSEIHGHAFRRIREIREGGVLGGGGNDKATAREVNHTLLSGNRSLDVKAADARKSERLIYTAWRGATTRVCA